MGITALVAVGQATFGSNPAGADPSADTWYKLRMCESSNNYSINTGNGYYGAYQFDVTTWHGVGGSGYPHEASPAEQDYRALVLYRMRGWQPWPACTRIVGLVEDADGGSGVYPDRNTPAPSTPAPAPSDNDSGTSAAPAWPGVQYFYGDYSEGLRTWQLQMKERGLPFDGTGYFGPKTLKYVKMLQEKNGLCVCGFIGPKTWKAAWQGEIP